MSRSGIPVPDGWEEVLVGRSRRSVQEGALVLSSGGIPHRVEAGGWGARILVPSAAADSARDELIDYHQENVDWPPPDAAPPKRSSGWLGVLGYGLVLVGVDLGFARGDHDRRLWDAGTVVAARVREGELERVLTGLTLHVDLQHLLGNLAFGALFGLLAAQLLGGGLAWLLAVLGGALGNLAAVWLHDASHRAVGASTGVFALLGLLAAYEWARRKTLRLPAARRLAPLFGGAVLLGWLGAGDGTATSRVDVLAHVTGLAAGGLLGVLTARLSLPERMDAGAQRLAAVAAVGLLAAAWFVAAGR